VNTGVGNRLDSVLSQAMYFGLAFSRVGLDFRVLIVETFENAACEQMSDAVVVATNRFEETMHRFSFNDFVGTELASNSATEQQQAFLNTNRKQSLNPPISLIEFYPLAIYLNALLQAFNDFRLCAPLNLYMKVKTVLEESLQKLSQIIGLYLKSEQNTFEERERELVKRFLRLYAYELVPYVERCYAVIFPIGQLQKSFSIQQTDLEKLKQFYQFDQATILEPIKNLIPEAVKSSAVEVNSTQAVEAIEPVEVETTSKEVENGEGTDAIE
jgi:conserved oligomeric Golgi complex subunit 8